MNNNNTVLATSDTFFIHPRLQLVLDSNQCPGSIKVKWNAIAFVSKYYVSLFKQGALKIIDSTSQSNYELNGLFLFLKLHRLKLISQIRLVFYRIDSQFYLKK